MQVSKFIEGGVIMVISRNVLQELIDEIPESQIMQVINFIRYLKLKEEKKNSMI